VVDRVFYRAVYYALSWAGETHAAEGDQVVYMNTQHNWFDNVTATLADRRTYWRIEVDFRGGGPTRTYVRAEALNGTELLSETEVDLP
jgi:hypothetical protein